MNKMLPCARFDNLVVQELKDEVLVCDLKSNQVFCLNQTAGDVWKLCDGKNNVKEISRVLSRKLKTNVSEEMVLFSLNELSKHDLLTEKVSNQIIAGLSRREVIKQIGLTSMIALPLISSVVMPRAAQAQSLDCFNSNPNGCACAASEGCDSGCCQNDICVPSESGGCPNNSECISDGQCASGCCDQNINQCSNASACSSCPSPPTPQPNGCPCATNDDCENICCGGGVCCRG